MPGVFRRGITTSDGKRWTDLNSDGLVTGHVVEFDVVSSLSAFVVSLLGVRWWPHRLAGDLTHTGSPCGLPADRHPAGQQPRAGVFERLRTQLLRRRAARRPAESRGADSGHRARRPRPPGVPGGCRSPRRRRRGGQRRGPRRTAHARPSGSGAPIRWPRGDARRKIGAVPAVGQGAGASWSPLGMRAVCRSGGASRRAASLPSLPAGRPAAASAALIVLREVPMVAIA